MDSSSLSLLTMLLYLHPMAWDVSKWKLICKLQNPFSYMFLSFYLKIIDRISRFPSQGNYWVPSRAGNNLLQKWLTLRAEGFLWKDQIHSSRLVPAAGRNTSHCTEISLMNVEEVGLEEEWSLPFVLQRAFSTIKRLLIWDCWAPVHLLQGMLA